MPRVQLFEFEDLGWFPKLLRNYGTDFLQFLSNKTKMYKPVIPILEEGLKKSNYSQIIDLCSGGGGGLLWLNEQLTKSHPTVKILLTDYYPNISAFEYTKQQADNIEYISTSVDARNVPPELSGLRTLFLSFHHFNSKDAKSILQNAVDTKQPIVIVEAQERSFPSFLAMFFSPLTVLFTTPFIKPFKLGRILFTYLIPVVPLFVWWDGLVSCLRTYSVEEMEKLVSDLDGNNFTWEIRRIKSGPGVILYLFGANKNT